MISQHHDQPPEDNPAAAGAFKRIIERLHAVGKRVREGAGQASAQCPSHEDREPSLAIYRKPGRIKLKCYAGCDDELDILPALGLSVRDLYDEPGQKIKSDILPNPAIVARIQARREMTPTQRAVDDLLHLPDLGERLCLGIARTKPELYISEREQLGGGDS